MKKLESDPANMAAEGIYRVPGDAAKIQRLRIDIDQVRNLAIRVKTLPCVYNCEEVNSIEVHSCAKIRR